MLVTACLGALVIAQAQPLWSVSFIVEPARESLRYRFDNPSSFDTVELVPHFFEQTYDTDNLWVGARIEHPLFGRAAETRFVVTGRATRRADDFDTFFQPDGNVIVSGTTGNASLRSWQMSERLPVNRLLGAMVGATFSYRRDTARYHEGTGIVTTTLPPTETRRLVTTRESVTSQLFEVGAFASASRSPMSATVELVAVGVGRLGIELPDKYPGQTIVVTGRYSSASVEGSYTRQIGPATARAGIRTRASVPWSHSSAMYLRTLSIFLMFGTN